MSVNVHFVANLGADPEVKQTSGGTSVATLRCATNERVKKGENWEDHTEWTTVVVFGKTAENCGEYLSKGSQIYVVGKLRTETYEKDGEKKFFTKIIADNIKFLGGKKDGAQPGGEARRNYSAPADNDDVPW